MPQTTARNFLHDHEVMPLLSGDILYICIEREREMIITIQLRNFITHNEVMPPCVKSLITFITYSCIKLQSTTSGTHMR